MAIRLGIYAFMVRILAKRNIQNGHRLKERDHIFLIFMNKRGFASPNFPHDRMKEMQRLGGKRGHMKGFACLTPEERKRIAKLGAKALHAGVRKKSDDPFDIV